ncbi:MAG: S-adenosylmethionine decarboxylase [Candidatus Thermoplasmatota archaeon]|nr:S-adenosylmethionine decarboxylase [Candidatus Thermoplasmatota archaeon]
MVKAHGKHVYIDYIGYQYDGSNNGEKILEIMIQSTSVANIRPVFSHVEEFDGQRSPPGFAAVVLLDESHITAHCYYEKGWLAFDAFTCGDGNPDIIADFITKNLKMDMPGLQQMRRELVYRFLHNNEEEAVID